MMDAYARWQTDKTGSAVIEIADSGVYAENLVLTLPPDSRLTLRAANGCRPVLRPLDKAGDRPALFRLQAGAGSVIALDGLMIAGHALEVVGEPASVRLSHCTLVPGRELDGDGTPRQPDEPSLRLGEGVGPVTMDHCILGAIQLPKGEKRAAPMPLVLQDSIVDALSPARSALAGPEGEPAYALLTAQRVTVFGALRVHAILLAENSLLTGDVQVARRQIGCLRFCYVPPGSRTPPRFGCQPDGVVAKLSGARLEEEQERVAPQFASVRYGQPAYAQIALTGATEIARGADDESEMGAFHDLFGPQRAANLQARLAEYTPAPRPGRGHLRGLRPSPPVSGGQTPVGANLVFAPTPSASALIKHLSSATAQWENITWEVTERESRMTPNGSTAASSCSRAGSRSRRIGMRPGRSRGRSSAGRRWTSSARPARLATASALRWTSRKTAARTV